MKYIIYFTIAILLFSCKKEVIAPTTISEEKISVEAKLKSIEIYGFTYHLIYDSITGKLTKTWWERMGYVSEITTYTHSSNRIFIGDNLVAKLIPNTKQIKSIYSIDPVSNNQSIYYSLYYFQNKIIVFNENNRDDCVNNDYVYGNGNCLRFRSVYTFLVGNYWLFVSNDTIKYTYDNLLNNKFAPLQQSFNETESAPLPPTYFLGLDGYYICKPNKNLRQTIEIKTKGGYNGPKLRTLNYQFNAANQLTKMTISDTTGIDNFINLAYY